MTKTSAEYVGPFYAISSSGKTLKSRTYINDLDSQMTEVRARLYPERSVLASDLQSAINKVCFIGECRSLVFDDIAWSMGLLIGTKRFYQLIHAFAPQTVCVPIDVEWKVANPVIPPQYYMIVPGKRIDCGELVPKSVIYNGVEFVVTPKFRFHAAKVDQNEHFFRPALRESRFVVSAALRQAIIKSKLKKCIFYDPSDMEVLW